MSQNKPPIRVADDDEMGTPQVDSFQNEIFFYTGVTSDSVLMLNKKLAKINYDIAMQMTEFQLKYPPGFELPYMPITLRINSFGGSVFAGMSAADAIQNSRSPVITIIDGAAASAATFMSVVGARRLMTRNSHALIHQLSSGFWGTFENIKDEVQNLNLLMERITEFYVRHANIPKKVLAETLKRDIWFDAKTCLKYGLVDEVIDSE
jgi:ATP-dependent Clp endopeptidase proteolytic subunit ClpP